MNKHPSMHIYALVRAYISTRPAATRPVPAFWAVVQSPLTPACPNFPYVATWLASHPTNADFMKHYNYNNHNTIFKH